MVDFGSGQAGCTGYHAVFFILRIEDSVSFADAVKLVNCVHMGHHIPGLSRLGITDMVKRGNIVAESDICVQEVEAKHGKLSIPSDFPKILYHSERDVSTRDILMRHMETELVLYDA